MRSIILFLLCAMPFSLAFCTTNVSGSISNTNVQEIKFSWYFFAGEPTFHTAKLENGEFNTSIPIEIPTFLWLQIDENYIELFLSPDDDLTIIADYANRTETISFSGKGSNCNNYLAEYFQSADQLGDAMKKDPELSPTEFMNRSNMFITFQLDELTELSAEFMLDQSFQEIMKTELTYREKIEQYRYISSRYPGPALFDKIQLDSLADYRNLLEQNVNASLISPAYRAFLHTQSLRYRYTRMVSEGKLPDASQDSLYWPHRVYTIAAANYTQEAADFLGAELLNSYLTEGTFGEAQEFYEAFIAACTNKSYSDLLIAKHKKLKQHYDDPNITAGIHLNSAKTEDGSDASFEELIAPFKGKVIYIDMWASWCGPCRFEMKNSAEFRKEFSDKGVVFMYLSVDESQKNWMTALSSMQVNGEHYLLSTAQDDEILGNQFNVPGIPYYIIVDKDGKIVDPNAKRPTDPELAKELELLLSK